MSFEPCASSFVKDLPIQPLSARQHAPRLISPLFFCPRETIERLADLTGGDFRSGKRPARGCVTYRDMPRRRGGVVNGEAAMRMAAEIVPEYSARTSYVAQPKCVRDAEAVFQKSSKCDLSSLVPLRLLPVDGLARREQQSKRNILAHTLHAPRIGNWIDGGAGPGPGQYERAPLDPQGIEVVRPKQPNSAFLSTARVKQRVVAASLDSSSKMASSKFVRRQLGSDYPSVLRDESVAFG